MRRLVAFILIIMLLPFSLASCYQKTNEHSSTSTLSSETFISTTAISTKPSATPTAITESTLSKVTIPSTLSTSVSTSVTKKITTTVSTTNTLAFFKEQLWVYVSKNLSSVPGYSDERKPAWIGIYTVGKSKNIELEMQQKFKEVFGFNATAPIEINNCGEYYVEGYTGSQTIYQYTITDYTYPLLEDEFYNIEKKICADGSPWAGFCMPGNLNEISLSPSQISTLQEAFCEWSGYSVDYIENHKNQFAWPYFLSEAGKMRTTDGKVLEVTFIYIRGFNIPFANAS